MTTPFPPSLAPLEPRDPTREELYEGPTRALPSEIQELAQEDTACTFCGVSYFVFAEVQALQATAKKYKKTFHVRRSMACRRPTISEYVADASALVCRTLCASWSGSGAWRMT
jgi:hypothetical protein